MIYYPLPLRGGDEGRCQFPGIWMSLLCPGDPYYTTIPLEMTEEQAYIMESKVFMNRRYFVLPWIINDDIPLYKYSFWMITGMKEGWSNFVWYRPKKRAERIGLMRSLSLNSDELFSFGIIDGQWMTAL